MLSPDRWTGVAVVSIDSVNESLRLIGIAGHHASSRRVGATPRQNDDFETVSTLPVDFHSFRRAFASALADAGVNAQHAMHLASHSDPRVHARYVMSTAAMRATPAAALPVLPFSVLPMAFESSRIVTGCDDSNGAATQTSRVTSAPSMIRTYDPKLRRLVLYPAELWALA